jgi:hypothetical protein
MERRPVARLTSMSVTESPMRTHCAGGRSRMSRARSTESGCGLHQLGPAGDAADDGVDQVSEVVVIEECLDRGLGVVADNHNWPADAAAGV